MKKTLYSCGNSYSDGSHLLSKVDGKHIVVDTNPTVK
jgi:hypothetical protein